jgi:Mrp family chromosome partitioning ATPase/uncharacterized protein involved in exopolysaccharide biosynthesis
MQNNTTIDQETKREYDLTQIRDAYQLSLRDYVRIVLVRKWVVLFIFVAFVAASIYYIQTTPPVYESKVLLLRSTTPESLPASIIGLPVAAEVWDKSQELLLKNSSSVAEIQQQLQTKYNLELKIEQIIANISLSAYKESSTILQLTAKANTSESAQMLANTAAEMYIAKVTELKRTELNQGVGFLEKQLERVEKNIQNAEQALNDFREKEDLIFMSEETVSSGLLGKLGELQTEQSQTEEEIEQTKYQLESVQELISEKKKYAQSSSTTILSPQLDPLQSRLVDLKLQLNAKLETLTEKDPEVIAIKDRIGVTEKQLKEEFDRLLTNPDLESFDPISELQGLMQQQIQLSVKLKGLEGNATRATEKIDRFKTEHPELIAKQVELTRLARQARVQEQTYMLLMDKYEEIRLLEQMKTSGLKIIDPADIPKVPISPKKKQALAIGIVFGLSLGIMVAFFLEYLDDSIKRKEDVERFLGLPVMGTIPKIEPFDVPENVLSWREESTAVAEVAKTSGLDERHKLNPPEQSDESNPLQKANDASINTAVQPDIRLRRRSRHRRGHRKRMQRLLSHSLLYAGRRAPVIENYRNLAANIRYIDIDDPIKSFLVTSAAPSEGKTITASNLAIVMAQSGKKVLLIDADLRRPRIHRIFQQDRNPGLADLLVDETDFVDAGNSRNVVYEENQSSINNSSQTQGQSTIDNPKGLYFWTPSENSFIRPTTVENLFLLPCGTHISNPGMLFTSERMRNLIKLLTEHFDLVIIDSPPILSAADAVVLATEVDGTLMVIESGKTKRQMSLQGRETLENVNAKVIGTVLNNVNYSKQYGSYYYYYYYYRSYYYTSDEEESVDVPPTH